MEVDHAFICTANPIPAGDLLVQNGLAEGSRNRHNGQGTANRRFFFRNFLLELLWIADDKEIDSEQTRPMTLRERFAALDSETSSPFGLGFRPSPADEIPRPDFDAWDYKPQYLPEGLSIQIANNTTLQEPLLFYLPFAKRREETDAAGRREPREHPVGWKNLTALAVSVVQARPLSTAAQTVNAIPGCALANGDRPIMELEFDYGGQGRTVDFAPFLPLRCKW